MIGPDFRSGFVRDQQTMRDLDALPWATESASRLSVKLSKAVIFGLTPICFMAWLVAGKAL